MAESLSRVVCLCPIDSVDWIDHHGYLKELAFFWRKTGENHRDAQIRHHVLLGLERLHPQDDGDSPVARMLHLSVNLRAAQAPLSPTGTRDPPHGLYRGSGHQTGPGRWKTQGLQTDYHHWLSVSTNPPSQNGGRQVRGAGEVSISGDHSGGDSGTISTKIEILG